MKRLFLLLTLTAIFATGCTEDMLNQFKDLIQKPSTEKPDNEQEEPESGIPTNQIWYTTTDGNIVVPGSSEDIDYEDFDMFDANIVSNTYEDGKGVITFDGEVTKIDAAFCDCLTIASVTLPNSIKEISYSSFFGCTSLTDVTLSNNLTDIRGEAFNGSGITTITIPQSVQNIEYGSFLGCYALTEFKGKFASKEGRYLIVDDTIHSFAPAGITKLVTPDYVTAIGEMPFSYQDELTEVVITDNITTIGDAAFLYCDNLTKVTLSKNLKYMAEDIFYGCINLKEVYFRGVTPPAFEGVFFDEWWEIPDDCKIYVPRESFDAYKTVAEKSKYADNIIGYDYE